MAEKRNQKKAVEQTEVEVMVINYEVMHLFIVGDSPLFLNSASAKMKQQLLLPPPPKSRTERLSVLKHDPHQEFRDSAICSHDPRAPTLLLFKSEGLKACMASAATHIKGATRVLVEQCLQVPETHVSIYGIPKLHMCIARNSDQNRTPDVRTRAVLDKWCCSFSVRYITPDLRRLLIANLLAQGGARIGIGDWRPEKGGDKGLFTTVDADNPNLESIVANGGRAAQEKAMKAAEPYDNETAELLSWFEAEKKRRGHGKEKADKADDSAILSRHDEDARPRRRTKTNGSGART